jgi:hypothetical protein
MTKIIIPEGEYCDDCRFLFDSLWPSVEKCMAHINDDGRCAILTSGNAGALKCQQCLDHEQVIIEYEGDKQNE